MVHAESQPVLLATALVQTLDRWGRIITIRALLDQGSEVSLATDQPVNRLGIKRSTSKLAVVGIGQNSSRPAKGTINFELKSRLNTFSCDVFAFILPRVTGFIRFTAVCNHRWTQFENLELADPDFHSPGLIDNLLGAGVYSRILKVGVTRGNSRRPAAQSSELGWLLSGNFRVGPGQQAQLNPLRANHQSISINLDDELYDLVKQF